MKRSTAAAGAKTLKTQTPFAPKRGRPTAAQVEAINRAIGDAAAEHFLSVGFEAASMEAVAARAGVSKGTLYARYPTKAALLHAVIEERVAAWSAESARYDHLLPAGLEDRLRYHARTIIRALANDEIRAFQNLVRGSTLSPELARDFYDTGQGFVVRLVADEIAAGTREDPAPAKDPRRVAQMLVAMLYGWFTLEESVGAVSEAEAIAFVDRSVDVLYAGRSAW